MIQKIEGLPPGCEGLRAVGTLTQNDYQLVLEPLLDASYGAGIPIRLLYHFGPEFEGFTAGAAWEDMRVGLHYLRLFERIAIVSDLSWIVESSRLFGAMMPCQVKVFSNSSWEEAVKWLGSTTPVSALTHHLFKETKLLLIEPHGPLRVEDFESLALSLDPWLEENGTLNGIVVRVPSFPGWESFGALLRHLRFVRDHHRKVQRVALCTDGSLADLGTHLAQHFLNAEIKHFPYAQRDDAVAWASLPGSVAAP